MAKRPTKAQFREWGRQGGLTRASRMTKAERRLAAIKAVRAREAKKNGANAAE